MNSENVDETLHKNVAVDTKYILFERAWSLCEKKTKKFAKDCFYACLNVLT